MKLTADAVRDIAAIVKLMLAGRYKASVEYFPYHVCVHVYDNTVSDIDAYMLQVAITADGFSVTTLAGALLAKGETVSEIARFLKSRNMLASWVISDESSC